MNDTNFYGSNNLEKYPDGKLNMCKKCITAHVDNFDPETYLWILQECDVPYIPNKWNDTLAKWGKDKSKLTGTTIIGRYLSAIKLKPYDKFRWKDNEYIQQLEAEKIETAMKRQGYSAGEIAQSIATGIKPIPAAMVEKPDFDALDAKEAEERAVLEAQAAEQEDYFQQQAQIIEDNLDLTDEDKKYLYIKWGKAYKPEEWVALEQLYNDMMNSYDIQSAGDINTLKLACKTSLKANQLLDMGDIEAAQKTTKMYNDLMKSGKWTAAQNKVESEEDINSIGELVALCERQGFIPKYYTDGPQDKVDRTIEDMQRYTHNLITEETNLSLLVERAAKQMVEEEERIAAAAHASEESEEDKLFDYDDNPIISDDDISELDDFIESEHLEDEEVKD